MEPRYEAPGAARLQRWAPRAGLLAATLLIGACEARYVDVSDPNVILGGGTEEAPPDSSVLVALVNPVVNDPHGAALPAVSGEARDDVELDPEPGGAAVTRDGVGVVDVPTGAIDLRVGEAALALDVAAAGDLIDVAIALDGASAAPFAGTPIRYPVGDPDVVRVDPQTTVKELTRIFKLDGAIVVMMPGVYVGDLMIKGEDMVIFGAGWRDLEVVIDGSVVVKSDGVRVRGVAISGDLDVSGEDFVLGFSRVLARARVSGTGGALLHNVFCGDTEVTVTDATVLGNFGVAPIAAPPAGACDP